MLLKLSEGEGHQSTDAVDDVNAALTMQQNTYAAS
jgi:hypothetical protein